MYEATVGNNQSLYHEHDPFAPVHASRHPEKSNLERLIRKTEEKNVQSNEYHKEAENAELGGWSGFNERDALRLVCMVVVDCIMVNKVACNGASKRAVAEFNRNSMSLLNTGI